MSRPEEYTQEKAVALCEQIALVGSVGKACEKVEVGRSTFYKWLASHAEFHGMYLAAKDEFSDQEFDKLDDMMNAEPPRDAAGNIDKGYPQLLRVRLEALKYRLSVLSPRKFAARFELTGAAGAPLVPPSDGISAERMIEAARRIAFMLHQADQAMREKRAPLLLAHEIKLEG